MPVIWKTTEIDTNKIPRFIELRNYLGTIRLNALDILRFDKSDESKLAYQPEDLYPPESLQFVGRDWRIINSRISVSFGGTLSPTADGFQMAILLAQAVVHNKLEFEALVVSGGGRGVDMAAHLGALDKGGRTIAVVANPVIFGLHPYIPKRSFLEDGILSYGGGIVSEYSEFVADYYERAVDRGRVITSLSDIFIAIECSKDSATVDAAKRSSIQRRKVLAIDWGKIKKKHHNPKTSGFDQLISEGIASPFPQEEVSGIEDACLEEQFQNLLINLYQLDKRKQEN